MSGEKSFDLTKVHEVNLKLLKEIDRICRKYNIKYPLDSGPLLGGVRHGFSTRRGGVSPAPWDTLNLGPGRGDAPENVEENYRRFFAALDMDSAYPVLSRQVHRDDVRLCTAADAGKGLSRDRDYDADALFPED